MKSHLLSKSESASLLADVSGAWGLDLPRTKNLKVYDLGGGASLVAGGGFKALRLGPAARDGGGGGPGEGADREPPPERPPYLPFLSEDGLLARFPSVTVDMGAVRFVCKGANIMRPGITGTGDFGAGRIVCVREESRGKYIAVGVSTMSSAEASSSQRGQVVATMHYVSDRYWEAARPALGRES